MLPPLSTKMLCRVPERIDQAKKQRRRSNKRKQLSGEPKVLLRISGHTEWWARNRTQQVRFLVSTWNRDNNQSRYCILNNEMVESVHQLCATASYMAINIDGNGKMELANCGLWAVVLTQEAWFRCNGRRWIVHTEQARSGINFSGLRLKYEGMMSFQEVQFETKFDDSSGVWVQRKIPTHEFGNTQKILQKISVLDNLLKRGGDIGLHIAIKKMLDPVLMMYDVPESDSAPLYEAKKNCIHNWGKKNK